MAEKTPEELEFEKRAADERTRRQVRMRYTGDGTEAVAGYPSDPEDPEFWIQLTDGEIERVVATGLFEHVGDYDAAADERAALARGPEKEG